MLGVETPHHFNYFGSPRIEIIEIGPISIISIISIIEMWGVGLEPSEDSRDFNYFNYFGSPRIEIIEITFLWMLGVEIPHHFNN